MSISSVELVMVMTSTGNDMVNGIWEANVDGHQKPSPSSTRSIFITACHCIMIWESPPPFRPGKHAPWSPPYRCRFRDKGFMCFVCSYVCLL